MFVVSSETSILFSVLESLIPVLEKFVIVPPLITSPEMESLWRSMSEILTDLAVIFCWMLIGLSAIMYVFIA
jgi:hypothetical protein